MRPIDERPLVFLLSFLSTFAVCLPWYAFGYGPTGTVTLPGRIYLDKIQVTRDVVTCSLSLKADLGYVECVIATEYGRLIATG